MNQPPSSKPQIKKSCLAAAKTKTAKPATTAASAPLRILLVRDPFNTHEDDVNAIRSGLADAGYELVSVADGDLTLPRLITATQPDLLIIESEAAARDLVEHVCVSTQHAPRPIILFTGNTDNESIRTSIAAGITAYIVDGLKPERVKAVLDVAYARFQFEQQLRRELEDTRHQLQERKLVERAKGLLMQQLQLTEDDAYRRLRKLSMEKNIRIADAAQRIIDISTVLE
jgi:response regulator NasT